MRILHTRDIFHADWTLGTLAIEYSALVYTSAGWVPNAQPGAPWPFGFIAEDTDRDLDAAMPPWMIHAAKVQGKTAIPEGEYVVRFTFSNRFQKEMPLLFDVPGFQGIRIHAGNTAADTEGCVCPALARDEVSGTTAHSRPAVEWLYGRIRECEGRKESVTWRIVRAPAKGVV